MERKEIQIDTHTFPEIFRPLMNGARVYDSSSSEDARVYFVDKDRGYFLKTAASGVLEKEAALYGYFHKMGLAPAVVEYITDGADYLLTERARGEDCTHPDHLAKPERLCDTLAEAMRMLHSIPTGGCPVKDRTADYIRTAEENYRTGNYDKSHFPDSFGYASAEDAWRVVSESKNLLRTDTLIHGDYCLPNIILDGWKFSSFIDVGYGGCGDRHIDIFWAIWSLWFNLKTDAYRDRFLDAYGRSDVDEEMLRIIAALEVFG